MADQSREIRFTEFGLGGEGFAIPVEEVTDILMIPQITAIPGVESSIVGLFNLRGIIVPVLDIARHFGLQREPRSLNSRVMVLQPEEEISFAIWVDNVWDIAIVSEDEIQKAPDAVKGSGLLAGLYTRGASAISVIRPAAVARIAAYAQYA